MDFVGLPRDKSEEASRRFSPPDAKDVGTRKSSLVTNGDLENSALPIDISSAITFEHPYHPIHWPAWKKWALATIYCGLQTFVTLLSTDYLPVEFLIQEKWGGSTQVVTLGQSMFIIGTAVGPVVLGPLSDIWGRKWLYVGAMYLYALTNIGIALPTGLPMLIIFMFLAGVTGSVALCNVAGTISDMFGDDAGAGQAMALFVSSANIGPSLGSPVGEWIAENPHMGYPWIGWINVIIGGTFATCMTLLPETLPSIVIPRTVKEKDGVEMELPISRRSALDEVVFTLTMALRIMITEPIVLSLGLYNGFAYGLLFLYLDGVFDVFVVNYGLSYIGGNLTYLNFAAAVVIMFVFFVPLQTWLVKRDRKKHGGKIRPESRFLLSLVTVWGFPISLFWFAWTSAPGLGHTSYWSPVIAGCLLGVVDTLLWLGMMNYITDSYPNLAGSAIAAFLIPSFLVAGGCAHLGVYMFQKLKTQVAVSILAGISTGVVILVYTLYFFGPTLRARSRYARKF
ncbi:MFS multidrug transporter-like protein [Cantharellus anzutake]|uniref:MFS multidrug transporter-like protein n=1 Tax=Cantharellus anzutake TaxID=1750568 RepID=UPI001905534F|nr:MFS multidrug transporter-like protein [Cantharellus anzutake]KAF8333589.1 MFS multidrug transporter-like protein [Cantharellus anzutake]